MGGSLLVTGFTAMMPHLMARVKAPDTTPAMFRTVFLESGRGSFALRWCPPLSSNRFRSRLRRNGVMSPMAMSSNPASSIAPCSR